MYSFLENPLQILCFPIDVKENEMGSNPIVSYAILQAAAITCHKMLRCIFICVIFSKLSDGSRAKL